MRTAVDCYGARVCSAPLLGKKFSSHAPESVFLENWSFLGTKIPRGSLTFVRNVRLTSGFHWNAGTGTLF